jgi:hypothetical protein
MWPQPLVDGRLRGRNVVVRFRDPEDPERKWRGGAAYPTFANFCSERMWLGISVPG